MESIIRGPFLNKKSMVLASASPRRQALLAAQGLCFKILACTASEPGIEPGEGVAEYVCRLAAWKAVKVRHRSSRDIYLSADTVVCLDGKILGKPKNSRQALEMLLFLRGKEHDVYSGVCILNAESGEQKEFAVQSRVTMAHFEDSILKAYVRTGEPMDKAGSYAIQGCGTFLVSRVKGSYTNVVGLPVSKTIRELLQMEVIAPRGEDDI